MGTHITIYTTRDKVGDHIENLNKEYVYAASIKDVQKRNSMLKSICTVRDFLTTHYKHNDENNSIVVFCHENNIEYHKTDLNIILYHVDDKFYTVYKNTS